MDLIDLNQFEFLGLNTFEWQPKSKLFGKGKLNIKFIDKAPWFQIESHFSARVTDFQINKFSLNIEKSFDFHFISNEKIELNNVQGTLINGLEDQDQFIFKDLYYDIKKKYFSSNLLFNIPIEYLDQTFEKFNQSFPQFNLSSYNIIKTIKKDGNLSGALNFIKDSNHSQVDVVLDKGIYTFGDNDLYLNYFSLKVLPKEIHFLGQSVLSNCPFTIEAKSDLPNMNQGSILLTDCLSKETTPLCIKWKNESTVPTIQSIYGYFYGIDCKLDRIKSSEFNSYPTLKGQADLNINKLSLLLRDQEAEKIKYLQIGNSFRLNGNFCLYSILEKNFLNNFCFEGNLHSQNAIFKGYITESIEANIKYIPGHLEATNINIQDQSGSLKCAKLNMQRDEKTFDWFFSMPNLSIKNFRPHLLKNVNDSNTSKFKTLIIRRTEMENISGKLDDVSTWRMKGFLHFLNPSRKDFFHPIFIFPVEIFSNLGLAPQTLNPVTGIIYYDLQDNKFYLNKFKDVYSEGRGSKFYLAAGSPSWIDINGNLSIQIRMKQNNLMFKLAELFTVSIEGNIRKPKYSLKKIEK